MSKNTKTYLLLGVVLLIWGIIGFRIASAISPEPETPFRSKKMAFKSLTLSQQDTFLINADYRDPFLGTFTTKKKKQSSKTKVVKAPTFDLDVRYTGSMVNHNSGKRIYFITISGQQYLLEKGKSAMEVRLVNGDEKTVTVRYKGVLKKISLQS